MEWIDRSLERKMKHCFIPASISILFQVAPKVAAGVRRSSARVVMKQTSMAHNEKRKLRSERVRHSLGRRRRGGEEMQLMKDSEDEEVEDK